MPVKMEKKEETISAFERRRLENIAANNAILRDLNTTAAKVIPTPKPEPAKRRTAAPRVKREPVKRESLRPTRHSSRLAGLDADSETLKRKAEVEAEADNAKARQKKSRVAGELKLDEIKVEGRKWDGELGGIFRVGAQPGLRTFTEEDVKETTDKELKELRIRMGGLKLYEKWAVNGRPDMHYGNVMLRCGETNSQQI
jgi:WD repeat-containing protein 76